MGLKDSVCVSSYELSSGHSQEAIGPDLQVVQEDEDGWWRTVIWVQGKLFGMVLGFWAGKRVLRWAVLAMELPLILQVGRELWSAECLCLGLGLGCDLESGDVRYCE